MVADMKFDREIYFDAVRSSMFSSLTQQQVDGQNIILGQWENEERASDDLRHLAYMLATTRHETASTMWPIAEYGAPTCGGASYAKEDPETKQRYYGRGFPQTTWRDNYARATKELGLTGDDDVVWHADRMLDPKIAADTMFRGMWEGWFRSPNTLFKYFSNTIDDPFNAREIINGDKNYDVSWDSRTIGAIIAGYHDDFLAALEESLVEVPPEPQPRPPRPPRPPGPPKRPLVVPITILQPWGVKVQVNIEEGPEPNWTELREKYEAWRAEKN
jgi:putative chitinase